MAECNPLPKVSNPLPSHPPAPQAAPPCRALSDLPGAGGCAGSARSPPVPHPRLFQQLQELIPSSPACLGTPRLDRAPSPEPAQCQGRFEQWEGGTWPRGAPTAPAGIVLCPLSPVGPAALVPVTPVPTWDTHTGTAPLMHSQVICGSCPGLMSSIGLGVNLLFGLQNSPNILGLCIFFQGEVKRSSGGKFSWISKVAC